MKIYLDMDGTFVDLYGVDGWLDDLRTFNARPYTEARPLVRLSAMARALNTLRANGYEICIVSWLARNSCEEYDKAVTAAKLAWLGKHLRSVEFDEIHILPYGTPKSSVTTETAILFDDENKNRAEWNGIAFDACDLMAILRDLVNEAKITRG